MISNKYIIGVVGNTGSGKDTVAKLLVSMFPTKAMSFSFSAVLREKVLAPKGIEPTRENLQQAGLEIDRELFAEMVRESIENQEAEMIILPGIRTKEDVALIRSFAKNLLIAVTTGDKLCFERMKARNEKPGEDTLTWEKFLELRQAPIELQIGELMKQADVIIENEGTLEELKETVKTLIASIA